MQRSQTTGFYDTFAQRQAVACIFAGSSSDSFLLTGLACVCSVGEREREAGPWRREGRSLCGQAGQSHPEGWVLRQQKRKTHLFSLLRTRWNVMVWSQKDQGGEYPRGKDQRKRLRERGKAESGSPPIASNSLVLTENMWMNLSRPCRLQRALPSARAQPAWSCGFTVAFSGAGGGTAEVNLSLYSVFGVGERSGGYIWGFTQRLVETQGVRTAEVWTAASFSALHLLLLLLLVVVLKPNWSIQLCRETSGG